MAKQKTHQATAKRFMVTKGKKIRHRKPGQDHFNARDTGKAIRKKRRDTTLNKTITKTVKILIN